MSCGKKPCREKQAKLCGRRECEICKKRSCASNPDLMKRWNDEKNPFCFTKGSHVKVTLKCIGCSHDYEQSIHNFRNKDTCRFCTHQAICPIDKKCALCYSASVAGTLEADKLECWSSKNVLKPEQLYPKSNEIIIFDCNICNHEFHTRLFDIAKGTWCPKCHHNKISK